jgi:hypothetical protein
LRLLPSPRQVLISRCDLNDNPGDTDPSLRLTCPASTAKLPDTKGSGTPSFHTSRHFRLSSLVSHHAEGRSRQAAV